MPRPFGVVSPKTRGGRGANRGAERTGRAELREQDVERTGGAVFLEEGARLGKDEREGKWIGDLDEQWRELLGSGG